MSVFRRKREDAVPPAPEASSAAVPVARDPELTVPPFRPAPPAGANFHRAQLPGLVLRWEVHTEFVAWTFLRPMAAADVQALQAGAPPVDPAGVPADWLASLPGECLTQLRLWAVPREAIDGPAAVRALFDPGSVTEGDILWGMKNLHGLDLEASEDVPISSFPRRRDYKAVTVTTDMPTLLKAAIEQNFVPVVDDRNVFIGMVRRTVLLRELYDKYTTLPPDKRFQSSHPPM